MTIEDIVRQTVQSQLRQRDVESFCEQEQIPVETFCDDFARYVANSYLAGHLSYVDADVAIAALFVHFQHNFPKFAAAVFGCFDAAEYERTKGSDPDKIARTEVARILECEHDHAA
jgi:hypothetical protein